VQLLQSGSLTELSLNSNTTGSNNIAVDIQSGFNLTSGSNDMDIGNKGAAGTHTAARLQKLRPVTFHLKTSHKAPSDTVSSPKK
jgi:hypothetical protein